MTDYRHRIESHAEVTAVSTLHWDAGILQDTLREAIRTSPGSFLMTEEDVKAESLEYWAAEIESSTWVVAQRCGNVVGVAAAKSPNSAKDSEDQAFARYIESLWIEPDLRGQGLAERLIKYLLEAEYLKGHQIRHFLLWVFDTNSAAISLYKRMGFKQTPEIHEGDQTEIKYRLDFESVVHAAVGLAVNEAARRHDKHQHGVTYRVLGEPDSS